MFKRLTTDQRLKRAKLVIWCMYFLQCFPKYSCKKSPTFICKSLTEENWDLWLSSVMLKFRITLGCCTGVVFRTSRNINLFDNFFRIRGTFKLQCRGLTTKVHQLCGHRLTLIMYVSHGVNTLRFPLGSVFCYYSNLKRASTHWMYTQKRKYGLTDYQIPWVWIIYSVLFIVSAYFHY